MEELAESIGKLSMNAKEWRPQPLQHQQQQSQHLPAPPPRTSSLPALPSRNTPSSNMSLSPLPQRLEQRHYSAGGIWQQQQNQHQQSPTSDLTAVSVNEFVPGRGWGGAQTSSSSSSLDMPWRVSTDQSGDSTSSFGQQDPYGSRASSSSSSGYPSYKLQQQQQPVSRNILPSRQAVVEPDIVSSVAYMDDGNDHAGLPEVATLPSGPSPAPPFRSLHTMAVSDDLWRYHRDLAMESHRQMDPSDPRHKAVPPPFGNAFCLDPPPSVGQSSTRSSFGYPSTTFQVTSGEDGYLYCLRRFDNVRSVSSKIASAVTERWTTSTTNSAAATNTPASGGAGAGNTATSSNHSHHPTSGGGGGGSGMMVVQHPGVVRFRRCFCAQRAVFFLHDYIPGARTLRERSGGAGGVAASVPEHLLWSAVSQLVSALRAIHSAKLAARCLTCQHILFNMIPSSSSSSTSELHSSSSNKGRWRLRINCLGVVDALEFEARKNVVDLQREDVRDLGRLIVTLATGTEITRTTPSDAETLQACEMYLAQHYSRDLHSLAMTLIRSAHPPTIMDVSRAMAGRIFDELDGVHMNYDRCEQALASEYESGRALRLLLKLGFINERPEFGMNRRWAQSGDCYVLTLFRDYVFHQADGAGNPVMDLGHVITALNKLDAADEEKIVLASRDGKSLLVVTYADVARCLDNAFLELCAGAVPPASLQY